MAKVNSDPLTEITYPVGAVSRLTGLTPDVLRAWERRYGVVSPLRTDGGTRRYRATDVERLLLVKTAVDSGHRISRVAEMEESQLRQILSEETRLLTTDNHVDTVVDALARLDSTEAERLLSHQLAALGPVRFAHEVALPLLRQLGEAWSESRICIASEHLGSTLLRSLLGSCLRPTSVHREGPMVVFGTPTGEQHEMGLLIAAITALGAGAQPVFLGCNLPDSELARAVETTGARALALSFMVSTPGVWKDRVETIRASMPAAVELWVGGSAEGPEETPNGVVRLDSMTDLEHRVEMLRLRRDRPSSSGSGAGAE